MDTQTLQDALALLRPGDTIAAAAYFHEPRAFLAELHTAAAQVDNLSLWTSNVLGDYPIMGEACDRIHWLSSFYERHARAAHPRKQVTYYPSDLHVTGAMMVEAKRPTVFVAAVPPMDPDGTYCISTSLQWEPECAAAADRIILEVNPAIPRADSPLRIPRERVACAYEVGTPVPVLPYDPRITPEEAAIGAVFGETTVTLRASDKFGNSDERSFTVKAPELVLSSDGFLLTYKNFTVPSFQNGGLVSAGSGAVGDKSIKVNGEDTSLGAEARFYTAEDGDYALWLLSGNGDNIPERHAAAYIDGERDLSAFNATTVLTWNKGLAADGSGVWHLKKGWHTVKLALSGAWLPYLANAVYITNDLDFEVTPELVPVITEQQSDTEAPVFGRTSVESEYTDVSECKLIIPEASDSSTVVSLLCYINGELREITGGYVQLTGLKPLEEVSVRVEAFDKFNNKAALDDTYAASPVRADGFAIYGQDGTALSGAEALKSGSTIYTSAVLTNKTGTDIETELSLCIYNADYTRMLLCKNVKVKLAANAENAAIRAELSVPQSKSGLAAGAMLWNAASAEPLICGTETGGAR